MQASDTEKPVDDMVHVERSDNSESMPMAEAESDSGVPPGYWTSYRFLGSCAAIILLANNLFIGYAMPVGSILLSLTRYSSRSSNSLFYI